MRIVRLSIVFAAMAIAWMTAGAAQPLMQPGRWEVTIRSELPVASPPMTTIVCFTKERSEKIAAPKSKKSDDCKVVSGGLTGNVLSYEMTCATRNGKSKSTTTYHGDRYETIVEFESGGVAGRQVITGKRLGECETEPEE